jgi:DNA-binding PadR family transcriptional regulator
MLLVLRAIAVLGGNADTFAIRDYISRTMESDTPTAQVSVMLVRLERRGLVSSLVPERIGKSRGRPRKVYSLTLGGKKDFKKESMPYGEPAAQTG